MGECCSRPTPEELLDKQIDRQLQEESYLRYRSVRGHILIIGLPGSGKTTLMQQLEIAISDIRSKRHRIEQYIEWFQDILIALVQEFNEIQTSNHLLNVVHRTHPKKHHTVHAHGAQ